MEHALHCSAVCESPKEDQDDTAEAPNLEIGDVGDPEHAR